MEENVSGCFFLNTVYIDASTLLATIMHGENQTVQARFVVSIYSQSSAVVGNRQVPTAYRFAVGVWLDGIVRLN